MSTDFICPVLYCLLQHRPKIFSILLKMFSSRNTDKLSEVCLRRTKLSPFIGGVGEKVIFDISSFCSDAGNKRFDHKMIFKPQNGTKDMKKNPSKWYFNYHVDYWSEKKKIWKLQYCTYTLPYVSLPSQVIQALYIVYTKIHPKVYVS